MRLSNVRINKRGSGYVAGRPCEAFCSHFLAHSFPVLSVCSTRIQLRARVQPRVAKNEVLLERQLEI